MDKGESWAVGGLDGDKALVSSLESGPFPFSVFFFFFFGSVALNHTLDFQILNLLVNYDLLPKKKKKKRQVS